MTIRVEPMRVEDCSEVADLLAMAMPDDWRTSSPADETQLKRVLAASGAVVILAHDGGNIVGLASGWFLPNVTGQGDMVMLDELLVAPSLRRQGIGTMLVKAFTKTARLRAHAPVEIWATTDFPEAPAATPFHRADGKQGGLLRQFDWPEEACP